jgi:pilus assembly protein Flp/PilA
MSRFLTKMWLAMRSEKGQSLVEYALILALVAIVVIAALTVLGTSTETTLEVVTNELPS